MMIKKNNKISYFVIAVGLVLALELMFSFVNFSTINAETFISQYAVESGYSGGNGNSENTAYKISTREDLESLSEYVYNGGNTSGKYYKMTNNIDMKSENFIPIGTLKNNVTYYFKGTFDGCGFSISNLSIKNTNDYSAGDLGLFGYLQGTVKNLITLSGEITLTQPGKSAGGIIGSTYEGSVIQNCYNSCCLVTSNLKGNSFIGGIIGGIGKINYGVSKDLEVSIKYCYNSAEITCDSTNISKAGGIVGTIGGSATQIDQCFNTGLITSGTNGNSKECYAGGIVGCSETGTISNCYNKKYIVSGNYTDAEVSYAGGIAGYSSKEISNCYNVANISAHAIYKTDTLNQPLNSASITSSPNRWGNIKSKKITVEKSYMKAYSAGIVGFSDNTIKNCYNNAHITGGKETTFVDIEFYVLAGYEYDSSHEYAESAITYETISFSYISNSFRSGINGNTTNFSDKSSNKSTNQSYLSSDLFCSVNEKTGSLKHSTDSQIDLNRFTLSSSTRIYYSPYSSYQDFSVGIKNEVSLDDINTSGTKINFTVDLDSDYISISVSTSITYVTSRFLFWTSTKTEDLQTTIYSDYNFYRPKELNYIESSNINLGDVINGNTAIWGQDSLINDNNPYLKNLFWTNSASSF